MNELLTGAKNVEKSRRKLVVNGLTQDHTAPSYNCTKVEAQDVITASVFASVSENGTTSNGNKIYDAAVDINDYLANLGK